jgi:hypothetical protein
MSTSQNENKHHTGYYKGQHHYKTTALIWPFQVNNFKAYISES